MFSLDLAQLGYSEFFSDQLDALAVSAPDLVPARVVADGNNVYALGGCRAPYGELSGSLRHTLSGVERPAAGDWVALVDADERAVIHRVLDRRTVLRRRAAGSAGAAQVIAANVDVFFVVTSANRDFNPRRIERYLTAVWDSGAQPVVVLNKVDLVEDVEPYTRRIEEVALGVPVVSASALRGTETEALRAYLREGTTAGFIGSSGVGKSSLLNRLRGGDEHATAALGADEKGRHTTTRRELVVLPGGGVLVDTPGMRELGMVADAAALDTTFQDIAVVADSCRFRDCRHEAEPGCAVREAVAAGELASERLDSYRKLGREAAAAEARRDPTLAAEKKRLWKMRHMAMRARAKHEPKHRR